MKKTLYSFLSPARLSIVYVFIFLSPLSTALTVAGEVPPSSIFGKYVKKTRVCVPDVEGKSISCEEVEDYLIATKGQDNSINVEIYVYYHGGHACELEGSGEWKGNKIIIKKKHEWMLGTCILEASISGKELTLRDQKFECKQMFCGARGLLDNVRLEREKEEAPCTR